MNIFIVFIFQNWEYFFEKKKKKKTTFISANEQTLNLY